MENINQECDGRRQLRSVDKTAQSPILEISPKRENRVKHTFKLPEFSSLFDKLPEDVKGVFRIDPFKHMLDIPRFQLNNRIIKHFMESVDSEFKSFCLEGRKVNFGPEDFAMSMGLGLKGRTVIWNGNCSSILLNKYRQIDQKAPTLEGLEVLVMQEIEGGGNKDGTLRAFYAYTLASLIFSVRRSIHIGHWPLLDNLEDVSKYAWGVAAYEFLREKLQNIPRDDHAERRLCGCTYMLQVLVLERGYAPSIPVQDAHKLPRMGRWSLSRLSRGMVEEILSSEPEKVIEQLKVEDWEVHFAIEMGVVSDQVTEKGAEADQMETFPHECEVGSMSCSTAATRIGDSKDPVVTNLKRKLEFLESKMDWAEKVYGVDWSLYPKSGDLHKDRNESVDHSPGIVGRVKCDPRVRMPSSKCISPFEQFSWLPGQKCLSKNNDSDEKIEWVLRHQKYMPTRQEITRLNAFVQNLSMKDGGDIIEVGGQQHLRVMYIREVMSPRGWVVDVIHRPIFLSAFIALMSGYPKQNDGIEFWVQKIFVKFDEEVRD